MWGEEIGARKVGRKKWDEKSGAEESGTTKVGQEKWDKKSGARKVGDEDIEKRGATNVG